MVNNLNIPIAPNSKKERTREYRSSNTYINIIVCFYNPMTCYMKGQILEMACDLT